MTILNYDKLSGSRWDGAILHLGSTYHGEGSVFDGKHGKTALFVRNGGKRYFVKGRLIADIGDDSPSFGLEWDWKFIPTHVERMERLLKF